MPIDKISRLKDYGVYRDFSWPTDLTDFGRYNLIYGWNGSGKTTLSRLFRDIELKRTPSMKGEVTLRIDGNDVNGDDFPQSTLQIRVFNRDFVYESIFSAGGGDVPPIFVVGKESVEKKKEVDRLRIECGTKDGELQKEKSAQTQAETAFMKHSEDRAKTIKDTLRSPGTNDYNNYNKTDYQGRAQEMTTDGNAATHRLAESARDKLLAQHHATPKAKVPLVVFTLPNLKDLADSVQGLLGTTVTSAAIQALKDDSKLAAWARDGLGLHKEHEADKCLFCEQPLPEGRLAALDAHFNAEYERLLKSIDEQILALEATRKLANDLRVPDRAVFYDDLTDDYDTAEQSLRQALNTIRSFIASLVETLNDKKAQPFKALALTASLPSIETNAFEGVNKVIRSHNKASDGFASRVNTARDRLALDMIAETLDEYVQLRNIVQMTSAKIKPIRDVIAQLQTKVTAIERDIRDHQQPAEELNEDLKRYLGHGDIQLTIKDTGYSIARNGDPANMLSEGEMTAIALLYFLKSLEDRSFDKLNGVVVLDDPVSSLDGNARFLAFGLIKERVKNSKQIILMTHDFTLFRQSRNWFHHLPGQKKNIVAQRPARFYMIECIAINGQRSSSIQWIDPLLEKYESEYHYLFACVYRVWSAPPASSLEDYYHVPNVARRLLEAFLAFKYPQVSGELHKSLELVIYDESRKTRILRFLHTQSHGADITPSHDHSLLGECRAVLQEMFDLMRTVDDGHCSAMIKLVAPSNNGDTGS